MRAPFRLDHYEVTAGTRRYIDLTLPEVYGQAPMSMPVVVCHGRQAGPVLFVSAAVHGDEIIGTEIIRRLLSAVRRRRLRGTLVAVPVVNAYGFVVNERYLPDRRDLNRSFPGSVGGSLAGRLADRFMRTIVDVCTHGIDLHSAAVHRQNLPQVRAWLDDPETARLATAFGTPVLLNSDVRDGSLREAARERGMPMILFEGGEALRIDETAVRAGLRGCWNVMVSIGMLHARPSKRATPPVVARTSQWRRAPASGLVRLHVALGQRIEPGQRLATITDPTGRNEVLLEATGAGIVIGRAMLPLVNAGDALLHVARFYSAAVVDQVADHIERFESTLDDPVEDEPLP